MESLRRIFPPGLETLKILESVRKSFDGTDRSSEVIGEIRRGLTGNTDRSEKSSSLELISFYQELLRSTSTL